MKIRLPVLILFLCILGAMLICIVFCDVPKRWRSEKLYKYFLIDNSEKIQFRFSPLSLIQGCNSGDLPDHFFLHPDVKTNVRLNNPGIISYIDFVIWAGAGFPKEWFSGHLNQQKILEKYETNGFNYVKIMAEKGNPYYQTILSGYYFYSDDTKKGLYWAEKAAESGESGSMLLLGDAYTEGIGVVQDDIEGIKWYYIASNLGNPAAKGRMLALGVLQPNIYQECVKQANCEAKLWMNDHKKLFISNE